MVSTSGLINANPIIYEKKERRPRSAPIGANDEYAVELVDQEEVFDILFKFRCFLILYFSQQNLNLKEIVISLKIPRN
ncbi:hypothetical protein L6164_036923 [Bauhinia variegata]|uniref:Uncharacterized protein n=1 Tax=Bauhinia variegata TaxID=167791 RepID=A0ACB9KIP5_BAUVA|nr:hypothetical protein L6164_036923 [Bauhinia variegata]